MDLDILLPCKQPAHLANASSVLTSAKCVGYEDTGKNRLAFPYPDTCGKGF